MGFDFVFRVEGLVAPVLERKKGAAVNNGSNFDQDIQKGVPLYLGEPGNTTSLKPVPMEKATTFRAVTPQNRPWALSSSEAAFFQTSTGMWLTGTDGALVSTPEAAGLYQLRRHGDQHSLTYLGSHTDVRKRALTKGGRGSLVVGGSARFTIVFPEDEVTGAVNVKPSPSWPLFTLATILVIIIVTGVVMWFQWTPSPAGWKGFNTSSNNGGGVGRSSGVAKTAPFDQSGLGGGSTAVRSTTAQHSIAGVMAPAGSLAAGSLGLDATLKEFFA
jgi:hypothetical protein